MELIYLRSFAFICGFAPRRSGRSCRGFCSRRGGSRERAGDLATADARAVIDGDLGDPQLCRAALICISTVQPKFVSIMRSSRNDDHRIARNGPRSV